MSPQLTSPIFMVLAVLRSTDPPGRVRPSELSWRQLSTWIMTLLHSTTLHWHSFLSLACLEQNLAMTKFQHFTHRHKRWLPCTVRRCLMWSTLWGSHQEYQLTSGTALLIFESS